MAYADPLRELVAHLGVDRAVFDGAHATLFGGPPTPASLNCRSAVRRPKLNSDGSPLQLAVSHRKTGLARRLLCDPNYLFSANGGGDGKLSAMRRAFTMWNAASLIPLVESAAARFRRPDPSGPVSIPDVVIGVSLDGPGAAIYWRIDEISYGDAWAVLSTWLGELFPAGAQAHSVVRDIAEEAYLVGVGVEGIDGQRVRLKIYWQLRRPLPLAHVPAPFVGDPAIAQFLNRAVAETPIGLHSLFFSTAFDLPAGEVRDGKVDVCGHCVPRSLVAWHKILDPIAAAYRLARCSFVPSGDERPFHKKALNAEFIGFGIDRKRNHRLNVYFSESLTDI